MTTAPSPATRAATAVRLRWRNRAIVASVVAALTAINAGSWSPVGAAARESWTDYRTSQPGYIAEHGDWSVLPVPEEFRVNAIHAALLPTGKVLIVAGSGNEQQDFDAGTFRTLLWDPADDSFRLVDTPVDLFCAGHSFLPNGNLLIAGGTRRYELLGDAVTHAAGPMTVKNENPDSGPITLPEGTRFVAPGGQVFASDAEVVLPAAHKMILDEVGNAEVHASEAEVFVEAVEEGEGSVVDGFAQYDVQGLDPVLAEDVYGLADGFTLDKQDFQGLDDSFEFNPFTEQYERVDDMVRSRWYPTLVGLADGNVLAVSGLDEFGTILPGDNELYLTRERQWVDAPWDFRYFPTYPSLFLLGDGRLFYSGSNAGYGPAEEGRTPGLWDTAANTFDEVPGLREPELMETSASVLLPPAQDQRVMVLGGGGVGESPVSTTRTDVVDLDQPDPAFVASASLSEPTRYLSTVVLPDDTVLTTGGSQDYRGKGLSDHHVAQIYDPATDTFAEAASPEVGRNYHSEALLLPDGRVVTLGSDPLFSDEDDLEPGTFEQRIEVYEPPYLHAGPRPVVTGGPDTVARGTTATFTTPDAGRVATARLMRPSAVTHVTDIEQRSIALDVVARDGAIDVTVPDGAGLVPAGWYMLFVTDGAGVPSEARWVRVP